MDYAYTTWNHYQQNNKHRIVELGWPRHSRLNFNDLNKKNVKKKNIVYIYSIIEIQATVVLEVQQGM